MRAVLFILLISAANNIGAAPIAITELRKMYYKAANNKEAAYKFLQTMESMQMGDEPVLQCYKGMAYMFKAKYSAGLFSKWSYFNKGKELIAQAVTRDPGNVEIHFMRFCAQTNAPSFLGYNGEIDNDKDMILRAWGRIKDNDLKEKIRNYLITSAHCSQKEKKHFIMNDFVVLVDEQDNATGIMEKMEVHHQGLLHRAISVFIFNSKGEMLLQKRAKNKYHSAGLWSNTCCSHPRPVEGVHSAASRRLKEEMGIECELKKSFSFIYNIKLENGLTEHEYDHVFIGVCDDKPKPDIDETDDWMYVSKQELMRMIALVPHWFTEWFKICIKNHSDDIYSLVNLIRNSK